MPAKGQTCSNCIGTCCHNTISYIYPPDVKADLLAKHESKEIPEWSTRASMDFSHKELLGFGMVESISPDIGQHCYNQLPDGKCSVHGPNKPRLCSSYWCHGRLWKSRTNLGPKVYLCKADIFEQLYEEEK